MIRPDFNNVRAAWNVGSFMEDQTVGKAAIRRFVVSNDAAAVSKLRSLISSSSRGRWTPAGTYVELVVDGEMWMSDVPDEFSDHENFILFARGRVLIHGLGLGCVVSSLLAKPEVDHIDVVELNKDVIDLVGPYYEGDRVTIHHGNAATYKWPVGTTWTCVWHDIWANISSDNLRDATAENGISYEKMHRKFANRCGWQESWAYDLARDQAGREKKRESRAQAWAKRYNSSPVDRRIVMLINATTPALITPEEYAEIVKVLIVNGGTQLDNLRRMAEKPEPMTAKDAYWLVDH